MLPMTLKNLRRVYRITFRRSDQSFMLETEDGEVVSMDIDTEEQRAPGFTDDCAFNFVRSVMATITGHRFTVVPETAERDLHIFVRQIKRLRQPE